MLKRNGNYTHVYNSHTELLEALKALLDIAPFATNEGDRVIHEQARKAIEKAIAA